MATIINHIELFNNAKSIEELKANLESYIENYHVGHVVTDRAEADQWFKEFREELGGEEPVTHWADCQTAHFTIADEYETQVSVKID